MRIQSWTCNIEEHQDASSPIFEMFSSRNKISIVELNDDNFLLWRFQVVTALEGYDLEKYLDSSLEPPSQFFNVKVETPQPPLACLLTNYPNSKPRIQEVKTQDQLISSWLLGLMNEDILNQMLNCNSTKDIWANLHGIYFARCLAQAMQLKSKLQNIKKRVVPLKEYFMKIQQCVDALASVAMVASHDLNMDSNWYPDSDVTNHLTNNFNNQFIGFKYRGERQVYDANGSGSNAVLRHLADPPSNMGNYGTSSSMAPFPIDVPHVINSHPMMTRAMEVEYTASMNNTWTLVPKPIDKEIIGCK
ncbi:uncharacterized protein LOC103502987 isoform X4 [Cucumis melo]|uniref:Uncharacterized protein LOC103502987 isoform X4 n=1 Tax=Cucumis melo TaxID=3656 RepID=A0ABM3L8B1_CUCME|nr:uncharacterized protein LOC103502987 isoform X4 [Cucumis melo]